MISKLSRLTRFVASFPRKRIAVVGDWMLDRYIWGSAARLSPEAPVPVVEFAREEFVLGGAGNVAANVAALGARVEALGCSGSDEFAGKLGALMRQHGMPDRGMVADPDRKTTIKTRIIAGQQQIVRVDRETRQPLSRPLEENTIRRAISALRGADAVILSDYDKGLVTEELATRVLGAAQKLGKPSFVKPKWSLLPKYPGASVIILNRKEAGFLVTRTLQDDAAIEAAGRSLLEHFKAPCVVITLGKDGMRVFEQDAPKGVHISATNREAPAGRLGHPRGDGGGRQVFDVTGAGDTVLAAFALARCAGASMREAALISNCAAGVAVGKLGTATLTRAELQSALKELR